jgi:hypothetical protein
VSVVCRRLHEVIWGLPRHRFPFDEKDIPANGIYVLFEKEEVGHGGDRIVRVGTHTGNNQLRSRLKQHFLTKNKDRSIFRKNIGRAILSKESDRFLEHWDLDLTTRAKREQYQGIVDLEYQSRIEKHVSTYIQDNFSFSVFSVDAKEKRLGIESKLISTVSWCEECEPSSGWLGLSSPKQKIRESGLWLVNELYKTAFTEDEVGELECSM